MEKYKVVIVGAGGIGSKLDKPENDHILTYAHAFYSDSRFEIIGFIDCNYKSAKSAAQKWGGKAFVNLQTFMDSGISLDIVVNCTPDHVHYENLRDIIMMKAGVIITEKPLTKRYSEAIELKKRIEGKKKLILNYSRRFIPKIQELKSRIMENEFGKFVNGTGYYGKGLLHNGSHMIDLFNFLLGVQKIESMNHVVNDYYSDDPSESVKIITEYGKAFYLHAISQKDFTIFEMDLFFECGRITLKDLGFSIDVFKPNENPVYVDYTMLERVESYEINMSSSMLGLVEHVVEVMNGELSICSFEDGVRLMELMENINRG